MLLMTLYFIGIGLGDEKDITIKGFEVIKRCAVVYLENYTSILGTSFEHLEQLCGKKILLADRDLVENHAEETILKDAKTKDTAFLVIGDPLAATTHIDLFLRAKKLSIDVEIIHNASIFTAITETGLQLYKFGPTTSIPFSEQENPPETPYRTIEENLKRGLHTLVLLDLRPAENVCMNIQAALTYLELLENKLKRNILDKKLVGCAGLGRKNAEIAYGTVEHLKEHTFTQLPQCLIIPGKLHFMEEEMLQLFKK